MHKVIKIILLKAHLTMIANHGACLYQQLSIAAKLLYKLNSIDIKKAFVHSLLRTNSTYKKHINGEHYEKT